MPDFSVEPFLIGLGVAFVVGILLIDSMWNNSHFARLSRHFICLILGSLGTACIATPAPMHPPALVLLPTTQPTLLPTLTDVSPTPYSPAALPSDSPSPLPPATAVILPAGTPALNELKPIWSRYENNALGYSFEFLSRCGLRVSDDQIGFGDSSYLEVLPAGGLSLEAYANQLMQEIDQKDGFYQPARVDRLGNHEPKVIVIEALVARRQSTFAIFARGDTIYKFWDTRWLDDCSLPEAGLSDLDVFYHSVESFTFFSLESGRKLNTLEDDSNVAR